MRSTFGSRGLPSLKLLEAFTFKAGKENCFQASTSYLLQCPSNATIQLPQYTEGCSSFGWKLPSKRELWRPNEFAVSWKQKKRDLDDSMIWLWRHRFRVLKKKVLLVTVFGGFQLTKKPLSVSIMCTLPWHQLPQRNGRWKPDRGGMPRDATKSFTRSYEILWMSQCDWSWESGCSGSSMYSLTGTIIRRG